MQHAEEIAELTDNEIISRVLAGEKALYEKLMRKYNSRLYRVGMAIVNDDSEIEDLMQNAYINAYEHLQNFEGRASFSTWLTRIMINECLQYLKKKKRWSANNVNEQQMDSIPDNTTPANIALNKELAQALETALMSIPEKYRLVFVMREMENMSIAETVETLDISESNVKVRLNRSKAMLRDKLNEYYKSEQVFGFHLTRCDSVVSKVFSAIGQ